MSLGGRIFTVLSLILLGGSAWGAHRQYTILKYWPTVDAVVTNSEVTQSLSTGSNGSGDTIMYGTHFTFRYTLDGKEFLTPNGNGYSTSNYASMKRQVDDHPPGSHWTLKYNPADPNDIRYDAGASLSFWFLPLVPGGIGIVFGGFAALSLFLSRREKVLRCPGCNHTVETGQKFCPECAAPLGAT